MTVFNNIEMFFTNPGNRIHKVYGAKVKSNGIIDLEVVGIENTDDIIQSFAESTDISFILGKLAAGDTSVLSKRDGSYGDFTQLPKTFAEVLQMRIDSKAKFDALPIEVKNKFNNDENQFFASAGSADWFTKLGYKVSAGPDTEPAEKKDEKKKDEKKE